MAITASMSSFIEEIMIKYGLENNLIEDDLQLKNMLAETNDLSYRPAIKLIFGEKIKEAQLQGKSLEEILPSARLKKIIESLINKKYACEDLPKLIEKDLNIDSKKANEISELIKNNAEIMKAIENGLLENIYRENEDNSMKEKIEEKIDKTNKKSIANMLLD